MLCVLLLQETPAVSRELNQGCMLMKFYDGHDIWHLLSSIALFFSFLVSFTLLFHIQDHVLSWVEVLCIEFGASADFELF